MTFITALEQKLNIDETENGARAYKSTQSRCLDLFGKIGACRNSLEKAQRLFSLAFDENPDTAVRILFWARDIRGGMGERAVFRALFKYLVENHSSRAIPLTHLVPVYGRWDDLLVLEDTSVWDNVLELISDQLKVDMKTESDVSLLAKWLPSINASSKDSKRIGRKIAAHLGWTERQYRKNLAALRTKIRIVEQKMCSKNWSEIDYEKVPSRAAFMYRKAFAKRDADRYVDYLAAVSKGEKKINAATLYPYDIVEQYMKGPIVDRTIDLQWEALPNYMEGKELNGLVVADVSGSMTGRPMAVSISLAMYIAERNLSKIWKNKFITFSEKPEIQTITGSTIGHKVRNLMRSAWGYNTDLMAVFRVILDAAKENKVSVKDMPQKLIIVSDMQFDQACENNSETNFEMIKNLYKKSGYELPSLVFWNVNEKGTVPMTMHDTGTCLVSGCSPSILKAVLSGEFITPEEVMNRAVYDERYDAIGRAFG